MRLNSRCLDVLDLLAASEKPLAASSIAQELNLSARMVRSSLASVEYWLGEKGVALRRDPGRGFYLVGSPESKRNLVAAIRDYDHPLPWLSPSARLYVILLTLFFAEVPPQIKQLQQVLSLSRTTTIRVLDAAKDWLGRHQLRLVRRPNFGCMIEGDEYDWRNAVVSLLRESCGDARLLAILRGTGTVVDVSCAGKTGLEEVLPRIWTLLEIPVIKRSIAPVEQDFARSLSDSGYVELFVYLALVIYRNRAGKSICLTPQLPKSRSQARLAASAKEIAHRLQVNTGMQLSQPEVIRIAQRLPAASSPTVNSSAPYRGAKDEDDPHIREIVDRITLQAALSLHPSLRADAELAKNLGIYLQTVLHPQQRGQILDDSLLREVKSQYPYVYSVARESSLLLTGELGRELSEAEVGDIAVCLIAAMERLRRLDGPTRKVLVVCGEGTVTAWLLVSRLRAEFPDVEVAEVVSALEFEGRKYPEGIDFIVSTIPLRAMGIPVMQVKPLLGVEDCRCLKEMFDRTVSEVPKTILATQATSHLSHLITDQRIELGVVANSWQEVVEKAGRGLLEAGTIDGRFIEAMKEVILEHGPYMVIWPGAVLLHARPQGVRELSMQLVNLRKPVCFGHPENDPVQIAIVMAAINGESHTLALAELNRMMQDEEARSAIGRTLHKSVVLHWVSRYSRVL